MKWYMRREVVGNSMGIHVRPAAAISGLASRHPGPVRLRSHGQSVDAKDILAILAMALSRGAEVEIEVARTGDCKRLAGEIARQLHWEYGRPPGRRTG